MSCNFCRDSIEGLKEVEIPPKETVAQAFIPTPQGSGGLVISPNFIVTPRADKLYQCQWCTEYWHKKLTLKVIPTTGSTEEWGAGIEFNMVPVITSMGHNLDKIMEELS